MQVGVIQTPVFNISDQPNPKPDWIAEEVPVALVYNGISHVVMMATPKQLELFAIGFSLAEGIISSVNDIFAIDIVPGCQGIEVQIELSSRRFMALKQKRRAMAGRTGCGICGTEQLAEVFKPGQILPFSQKMDLQCLPLALEQLKSVQQIGKLTGCTHAAGWIDNSGQFLGGCEDIGRHVALDKLLGLKQKHDWQDGAIIISSRASYEMVQKAVNCGVEILFAISAVTSLAVEIANQSNLTLVGFCRNGKANVYTHPQRIASGLR